MSFFGCPGSSFITRSESSTRKAYHIAIQCLKARREQQQSKREALKRKQENKSSLRSSHSSSSISSTEGKSMTESSMSSSPSPLTSDHDSKITTTARSTTLESNEATKSSPPSSCPRSSIPGAIWCPSRQTFVINVHTPRMTLRYYKKQKQLWEHGLRITEDEFERKAATDGIGETMKDVDSLAANVEWWKKKIEKLEKELAGEA